MASTYPGAQDAWYDGVDSNAMGPVISTKMGMALTANRRHWVEIVTIKIQVFIRVPKRFGTTESEQ